MNEPDTKPDGKSTDQRCTRSVILGPSPFDVFFLSIVLTGIAVSLLLPILQWLRVWFG
jgi:hypothetical protein